MSTAHLPPWGGSYIARRNGDDAAAEHAGSVGAPPVPQPFSGCRLSRPAALGVNRVALSIAISVLEP